MKASELRIGNLVMHYNDLCTVIGYYENIFRAKNVNKTEFKSNVFNLQPIPLTEEWLLKLGFEKIPKKQYMTLFFSESDLSKANNLRQRIDFWFGDIDFQAAELCFYGVCFKRVKMQYVHQLQNLYFALTGQELTFKSE